MSIFWRIICVLGGIIGLLSDFFIGFGLLMYGIGGLIGNDKIHLKFKQEQTQQTSLNISSLKRTSFIIEFLGLLIIIFNFIYRALQAFEIIN